MDEQQETPGNGRGRSLNFLNAAFRVRGYQPSSVLENVLPTGNGMAAPDKQRLLLGAGRSPIGSSESTFDKSLWIRNLRANRDNY